MKIISFALAILLVLSSSGARADALTDLLVGGSAEKPAETKVIATKSTAQNDRNIRKRLLGIYAELDNLNLLRVAVSKSVVTLRGEVTSSAEEEKAISLAKQIEGVVEVENELVISQNVEKRLETTWNKVTKLAVQIANALPLILVSLLVFIVFWMLGGWLSNRQRFFRHFTRNHFVANLLGQFVHLLMIVMGLVLALSLLDATALLGTIMGAAGIFGLAIGFAVRDTVENYIASILLSLRNPFHVNDFVEISGNMGSVARLTTRATILISPDGNHVRIPNAEVFKAVIINYTRNPERRFQFDIGVGVGQDLNEVQQLAVDTLNTMEGVLDDPKPMALVKSLGDFNVIVRVYGWVNQKEFSLGKVSSEAIKITKQAFDNAGIVMPEPISQIRIADSNSSLQPTSPFPLVVESEKPAASIGSSAKSKQATEAQPPESDAKPRKVVPTDLAPDETAIEQILEESESGDNQNLLSAEAPTE